MKVNSVIEIFDSLKKQGNVIAEIRTKAGERISIDTSIDDWEIYNGKVFRFDSVCNEPDGAYIVRRNNTGSKFIFIDEISTISIKILSYENKSKHSALATCQNEKL